MGKPDKTPPRKALAEEPVYIKHRLDMFTRLYETQQAELAAKTPTPIKVTMPDGGVKEALAWKTTPYDIALEISNGLAQSCVIAKVNGKQWDMTRVLEEDSDLVFVKFDEAEGKEAFWHSSSHLLGEAMELMYGGDLAYGPPIESGFFYDMMMKPGDVIRDSELKDIEAMVNKMSKEKQAFERLRISKVDLLEMFKFNPFKQRIIREKVQDDYTTAYRCGPLIDLCRGPHIRHAGLCKGVAIHKASSSYWEGKADAETLQRVYGITFPDKAKLKEWKVLQEEAAKRDHRKIGTQQELFFFHEWSAGSAFFLPHGARIYNALQDLMRAGYKQRGFEEVVTPNIFNTKLWATSGHLKHYADDMFMLKSNKAPLSTDPELDQLKLDLEAAEKVVAEEKAKFTAHTGDLVKMINDLSLDESKRKEATVSLNNVKAKEPLGLRRAQLKYDSINKKKTRRENVLAEERTEEGELLKLELEDAHMALESAVKHADQKLTAAIKTKGASRGELFFLNHELRDADEVLPKDQRVLHHGGCC